MRLSLSPPPPHDETSALQRWKRYARVSGAAAGVGARFAYDHVRGASGPEEGRALTADYARHVLGGLKGPLMKVAQFLAAVPDVLPESYAREFSQLQANAPSMGWPFVRRRMAAELGPDWETHFATFTRTAAAAASLGQVHRAQALDGRDLACKLQYPAMDSVVEADLRQLKVLLTLFEHYDGAIVTNEVLAEVTQHLREELDYDREAKNLNLYKLMLDKEPTLHVPEVIPSLSTNRLLTMTWLEGQGLDEALKTATSTTRARLAEALFRAWYAPFYRYGVLHGDPHPGNYTARVDGTLNLLDLGCVRLFPPSVVGGVVGLYEALRNHDEERAVEAYKGFGFPNPTKDLVATLNIWATFIYAPLLEDRARSIDETNTGLYGREAANKVHRALREKGGIVLPRAFVFMDRAAVGLGSMFLRLGAVLNWHRLFLDLITDFDESTLASRQADALTVVGLCPSPGRDDPTATSFPAAPPPHCDGRAVKRLPRNRGSG